MQHVDFVMGESGLRESLDRGPEVLRVVDGAHDPVSRIRNEGVISIAIVCGHCRAVLAQPEPRKCRGRRVMTIREARTVQVCGLASPAEARNEYCRHADRSAALHDLDRGRLVPDGFESLLSGRTAGPSFLC